MDKNVENVAEQSKIRRQKLNELRESGSAYPHFVKVSHTASEILQEWGDEEDVAKLELAGQISIAGRVHFLRSFGKAGFVKILSNQESFQLYVAKDKVESPESFQFYKSIDLGDIVHAEGRLFRTKTNELSLEVKSFKILSKCLHTPPEKFHGLTDVEERYRRRYVDLMSNEETRRVFRMRSEIIHSIRDFFQKKKFVEVETPMMHSLVSGAAARPFQTHHNTLDMDLFLRIAPELHLKRLVVGGMDRVFEINRNFRNEGISIQHNPEFTMIEFYWAYADYRDLMNLTEELVSSLCQKLHGKDVLDYQGTEIKFGSPWQRLSMEEAVSKYSDFNGDLASESDMRDYLKSRSIELSGREGKGALLTLIFEEDVEAQLIQPTFITGFPVEVSPLARRSEEKSENGFDLTERFELFVYGRELANGFNELNDPDDQKERFQAQLKEKEAGNEEAVDYDEDYIQALEYGLPPTAGEGIGIDRLVMFLTNSASIRDVILFPQLRNESTSA